MELLAQAAEAGGSSNTAEIVVFWIFAVIGVGAGIAVITLRNIVHGALALVVNLLAIAVLFLALESQFLGIIQVIVYAGAIMVLFLFVIMLLGVDRDDLLVNVQRWHVIGAIGLTTLIAAGLVFGVANGFSAASSCPGAGQEVAVSPDAMRCEGLAQAVQEDENGAVGVLANRMFTRYTFPFEAAALLLVVATIGALVMGRRTDRDPEDEPAYAPSSPLPTDEDVAAARTDAEDVLVDTEPEARQAEAERERAEPEQTEPEQTEPEGPAGWDAKHKPWADDEGDR